nr:MAG TPA: hypothetical protein [Caudoviricetes sp.]
MQPNFLQLINLHLLLSMYLKIVPTNVSPP